MSETYNVVFTGELLEGFDLESVQRAFADIFKLSQTKVNNYFTGQSKLLKKEVSLDIASKYKSRIESVGGKIEIQPVFKPANMKKVASLDSVDSLNNHINCSEEIATSHSEIAAKANTKKTDDAELNDSMNAIEIGRLNQIRKMQAIELEQDKNSNTLIFFGGLLILLGIVCSILDMLSIFNLTGTMIISISLMLIGLIFIKSSKAS